MTLFRVSAAHSGTWQLISESPKTTRTYGVPLDSQWNPIPLILYRNKIKVEPDFWDFDQGAMFAVSERVRQALNLEHWGESRLLRVEVRDPKGNPIQVDRHAMNILAVADVMEPSLTMYKPYGDRVLDFDRPETLVVDQGKVPPEGLFLQPSGSWREILCTPSFKSVYEAAGWTGLDFRELNVRHS